MLRTLRRWPRTVQGRVVIAAVLATGALLIVAGWITLEVQERSLRDRLAESLDSRSGDIAALVVADALPARLAGGGEHAVTQVVGPEGRVIASTVGGERLISDLRPEAGASTAREIDGVTEPGHRGLLVARGVEGPGGTFTVIAAEDFEAIERSTKVLGGSLAFGLPLLLVALGVITGLAVRRALAPVEKIRREIDAIGSENLGQRVERPATDDEIARLADTGNALLERLEAAFRREQRFVADASHELRSPLAVLRSRLELGGTGGQEEEEEEAIQEVARIENLVDDLLHLARHEEGADTSPPELLDLDDIVLDEVARAGVGGAAIDARRVSAAQVRGVRGDLTRLVRNLLDNATRHGAGRVDVSLGEADGAVLLTVDDDGPGIPSDQRESVFERFARVDSDRGRATGGTGLGLAIARAIAGAHGGAITICDAPEGGARFVVRLPVA